MMTATNAATAATTSRDGEDAADLCLQATQHTSHSTARGLSWAPAASRSLRSAPLARNRHAATARRGGASRV